MGTKRSDRISELKKKKQQLANRIARLSNLESAKERKERTRKLILEGIVVEDWLRDADDAELDRWQKRRDTVLKRDRDRAVFGLPPREVSD